MLYKVKNLIVGSKPEEGVKVAVKVVEKRNTNPMKEASKKEALRLKKESN